MNTLEQRIIDGYIEYVNKNDPNSILGHILEACDNNAEALNAVKNGISTKLKNLGIIEHWNKFLSTFTNDNIVKINLRHHSENKTFDQWYYLFEVSIDNLTAEIPYSKRYVSDVVSTDIDFSKLNDYIVSQIGNQEESHRIEFYFDVQDFLNDKRIEEFQVHIEPEDLKDFLTEFLKEELLNISDNLKKDMENKSQIISCLGYIMRHVPLNQDVYIKDFPTGNIHLDDLASKIIDFHDILNVSKDVIFFEETLFDDLRISIHNYQKTLINNKPKVKI